MAQAMATTHVLSRLEMMDGGKRGGNDSLRERRSHQIPIQSRCPLSPLQQRIPSCRVMPVSCTWREAR